MKRKVLNQAGVIFAIYLLLLFLSQTVYAACTGASPTWTAADPSNTEISACITAASGGDTIIVPPGTAYWTGSVRIPDSKKITLQGSGIGVTVIGNSSTEGYTLAIGLSGSRITGFTINRMFIMINGTKFRIDHNYFYSTDAGYTGINYDSGASAAYSIPSGVIDNNTFYNGRIIASAGGMINNTDWTLPTGLGSGDDVLYVEDNIFNRDVSPAGNCIDGNYGGAYVFRYNTVNGNYLEAHSVQGANRAHKRWEIYGNLQNKVTGVATYYATRLRGGTGVMLFNRVTGDWSNQYIGLDNVRSYSSVTTYGKCDGTHAGLDGNEDATGYPCRDQIGRGSDTELWISPSGTYTQPLEPAYFFGNIGDSGIITADVINYSFDHIKTNRDYYEQKETFDGTKGVGCGTLANRPTSCTPGVAYWATEQSCTNMSGMVGVNPTTPIEGTLYKCNASGQWEGYYTPYAYPHPLRGGNELQSTKKSTLFITSVNGTVTSSDELINCGSTCAADYDPEISVTLTATPNSGYTLTGWSGGGCAGTGTCTVVMSDATFVTANFAKTAYNLTITKPGTGMGTVTGSDNLINCGSTCSVNYESGNEVILTASPGSGSVFSGWSGACTGTGTCSVAMTEAKTVAATFTPVYNLTVTKSVSAAGTVTSGDGTINCGSTCSANYDPETLMTLSASANSGYVFTGWMGGGCSGSGSCTVSMNASISVTATFATAVNKLTVIKNISIAGTVVSSDNLINCGSTCSVNYETGKTVALTAVAKNRYRFSGWSGACSGTGVCTVSMTEAKSAKANFYRYK